MSGSKHIKEPNQIAHSRRVCSLLLVVLFVFLIPSIGVSPGHAEAFGSAYDLIAAVNQLRQDRGLPPYEIDGILMSVAQTHSDYQASIGLVTHSGPGGSRPRDRAVAAGYGSGAAVYVSENIAGGGSMTVQGAVQMWQGDSLHLNTMLSSSYTDAGAGVASDGNMTYYTLDVGYVADSPGNGGSSTPAPGNPTQSAPATQIGFYPVLVATPRSDGSVVHVVQPGQTLWTIAATYEIEMAVLLDLNGLPNNAFIYPGDKLLIQPADDIPEKQSPVTTKKSQTTSTPKTRPTRVRTPTALDGLVATGETGAPEQTPQPSAPLGADPILTAIGVLVLGGAALLLLGYVLNRGG